MDIKQPIIHDRFIVKQYFEQMRDSGLYKNLFNIPDNLTIVTCRNKGTMIDRIIPHLSGYEDVSIPQSVWLSSKRSKCDIQTTIKQRI